MEIISSFIQKLKSNYQLSTTDEQLIYDYFEIVEAKKNDHLLNAGEICTSLFYVYKGLLRTYHLNANGSEFTRLLAPEEKFCTVLMSFQEKIPSPAYIQALENSILLKISLKNFKDFIEKSESANRIYLQILEEFQNYQIQRIEVLTQLNPQEKVEKFLKENQDLEPRLADKIIASYLQIAPETYSRCKKNIK